MEIDLNNSAYYEYDKNKTRTKERLQEIKDLGLTEIGIASFGIKGYMSGLYIEKIWRYSSKDWKGYIDWIKRLKVEKHI